MALEESPISNDNIVEIDGVKFLIHESEKIYFEDTVLDYIQTKTGYRKFTLENCKYELSSC